MNSIAESIASRIKICILQQSFWNSKRQHKTESREENSRHGLDRDAEVYVRLTKHESLTKAAAVKGQIYASHRKLTLPSPVDGMRIVPIGREFEHAQIISDLRETFKYHVNSFLEDYDNVVMAAEKRLNGLFDSTMFPPKELMKDKFCNNVTYMETPTNGSWTEFVEETAKLGQLELRDRIVGAARKLIEVCNSDGKLYSSVLENLGEICEMAGDFNLMEDPIIAKAAKELKPIAMDFPAEILRENKALRRETSARAQQILSVLNLG